MKVQERIQRKTPSVKVCGWILRIEERKIEGIIIEGLRANPEDGEAEKEDIIIKVCERIMSIKERKKKAPLMVRKRIQMFEKREKYSWQAK